MAYDCDENHGWIRFGLFLSYKFKSNKKKQSKINHKKEKNSNANNVSITKRNPRRVKLYQ